MNSLVLVILGLGVCYLGYAFYAKRVDAQIIKADRNNPTPAKRYNDGVDFMPTDRHVLYGYQFKSIAGSGPIIGTITAAAVWGWLPAVLWLSLGVTFVGWVQDYTAMMMSVRKEGDSLTAIAHRLISPNTRTILVIFIFFYLLVLAAGFGSLISSILVGNPSLLLCLVALSLAGMLGGQMIYVWKMDLVLVTMVIVGITLLAILIGPLEMVAGPLQGLNTALDGINGNRAVLSYFDPLAGAQIELKVSYIFWLLFVVAFSYGAAVLPIWRYAQPMNYIGFWVILLIMVGGFLGLAGAIFVKPSVATLVVPAFTMFDMGRGGAAQPLWPMLFVTIACGAISGWHSLVSTAGTGRQLEYETDALPVGAGSMFSEMLLGLLALIAFSVSGKDSSPAAFAVGLGGFLSVLGIDAKYGSALVLAAFVIMVLTVSQLILRFMRIVFAEALENVWAPAKNMHVGTLASVLLMIILVLSGGFVYLWQLFGGANQLMAALALLLVTLWLVSEKKNPAYALLPMLFMYVTTIAANLITARNLWVTVVQPSLGKAGREIIVVGASLLILIALFLVAAALYIGYDGWRAYKRMKAAVKPEPAPAA